MELPSLHVTTQKTEVLLLENLQFKFEFKLKKKSLLGRARGTLSALSHTLLLHTPLMTWPSWDFDEYKLPAARAPNLKGSDESPSRRESRTPD